MIIIIIAVIKIIILVGDNDRTIVIEEGIKTTATVIIAYTVIPIVAQILKTTRKILIIHIINFKRAVNIDRNWNVF